MQELFVAHVRTYSKIEKITEKIEKHINKRRDNKSLKL